MIHRFPTTPTHTTPVDKGKTPLNKIIIARIQPHTAVHKTKQKDTLLGALTPQTLFQGKEIVSVPQIAQ